jgi:hypothetical protein
VPHEPARAPSGRVGRGQGGRTRAFSPPSLAKARRTCNGQTQ